MWLVFTTIRDVTLLFCSIASEQLNMGAHHELQMRALYIRCNTTMCLELQMSSIATLHCRSVKNILGVFRYFIKDTQMKQSSRIMRI